MGLRMQPRHETFVTLFGKAGSNIVKSVASLMAFAAAPHERWAGLAKRRGGLHCSGSARADQGEVTCGVSAMVTATGTITRKTGFASGLRVFVYLFEKCGCQSGRPARQNTKAHISA
jgi:hypothetical protein